PPSQRDTPRAVANHSVPSAAASAARTMLSARPSAVVQLANRRPSQRDAPFRVVNHSFVCPSAATEEQKLCAQPSAVEWWTSRRSSKLTRPPLKVPNQSTPFSS